MSTTVIKQITTENWTDAWLIVEEVSKWLSEQGLNHWSDYYTQEIIKDKVVKDLVFVLYEDDKPVGVGAICSSAPEYYSTEDCKNFTSVNKSAFLTTLGVIPSKQGKGYGKLLVKSREEFLSTNKNYDFICFDAKASYVELIIFHLKNGYKIVGFILDEGEYYYLFEKKLR